MKSIPSFLTCLLAGVFLFATSGCRKPTQDLPQSSLNAKEIKSAIPKNIIVNDADSTITVVLKDGTKTVKSFKTSRRPITAAARGVDALGFGTFNERYSVPQIGVGAFAGAIIECRAIGYIERYLIVSCDMDVAILNPLTTEQGWTVSRQLQPPQLNHSEVPASVLQLRWTGKIDWRLRNLVTNQVVADQTEFFHYSSVSVY